jgi:hypothetical protein
MQSQIPGLREGLRPEIDFLGRTTPLHVMGGDSPVNRWVNPLHYSTQGKDEPITDLMAEWQSVPPEWPKIYQRAKLSGDQIYLTRIWAGEMFREIGNAYAMGRTLRIEAIKEDGSPDTLAILVDGISRVNGSSGKTYEALSALGAREGIEADLLSLRNFAWDQAIARLKNLETNDGKQPWALDESLFNAHVMNALEKGNRAELIDQANKPGQGKLRALLIELGVMTK